MDKEIMVSIVMITYNHEAFISQAIEGVLMQEVDFTIELIISNDRSPDNTEKIVKNLINSHPKGNLINYTLQPKNLGMSPNFLWALNEAKGEYVALCEGDDFWTDPYKLQKQVDFLEKNQDYGIVCGGFDSLDIRTGEKTTFLKDNMTSSPKFNFGFDIDLDIFWNNWCIQTLTVVYRNKLFDFKTVNSYDYKYFIDLHLFYYLILQQKGFYFQEILGTMHISSTNVYSNKSNLEKIKLLYHARREIFSHHKADKRLKSKLFSASSELYINKAFVRGNTDLSRLTLFRDMLVCFQGKNELKHIIRCVLTSKKMSKTSDHA